jgi:ElaB/YqjD/DUF883 family membrane-anchored ribosome-binding protein
VLEPQIEFTASQVRALKEFYEDFFDAPPRSSEAKTLGKETGAAFQELVHQLTLLASQVSQYPFLATLSPVLEKLKEFTGKPYTWYLTELVRQEDVLLDMKEDVLDPVRKFMGGAQKEIYNQARTFIKSQEPNFSYVKSEAVSKINSMLEDPDCFKGNRIQQLKSDLEVLKSEVDAKVQEEKNSAFNSLKAMKSRMKGLDEYKKLPEPRTAELEKPFQELIDYINQQTLIAVIRDKIRYFEEKGYQKLLMRMVEMSTPKLRGGKDDDQLVDNDDSTEKKQIQPEYLMIRRVKIDFDKAWLSDESDVNRYLESMRNALLTEIRKGKRIQI